MRRLSAILLAGLLALAADAQSKKPGLKLPPVDPNAPLAERPAEPAARFDVLAAMKALKPLQKVHYSYAVEDSWLTDARNPLVLEYVRLTHALCVRGERVSGPQLDAAAAICAAVSAQGGSIPASIGINYSVWHTKFPKTAPPTETGRGHDEEVGFFRARLEQMRDWLAQSNTRRSTDVQVTAILLDCERFHIKEAKEPDAAAWNEAIRAKHDEIYRVCKDVFPKARVVWYALGGAYTGSTGSCWRTSNFAPTNVLNDCWSVSLYRPHELLYTREQMRRTVEAARAAGVTDVIPWVALSAGYRLQIEGRSWLWDKNWDYGLAIAWQIGAEINVRWFSGHADCYAPWDAAPFACFYPGPFYPRNPLWPSYFIAYVRGANEVRKLSDIPTAAPDTRRGSPEDDDQPAPADGVDDPV